MRSRWAGRARRSSPRATATSRRISFRRAPYRPRRARRLKLPRAAAITAVGGSDRVVWMTTQQEPARIDVIPLVNRGQPKLHELPEPIAAVSSHPRSDLLVCVGGETGRLYVVDLDHRGRLRVIGPEGIE